MLLKKYGVTYLLLFIFAFSTQAQLLKHTKYDYWVNGQVFKGFILQHTSKVAHLVKGHPTGFELNLQQELNGNRAWEKLYNYPVVNFGLSYYDLKNDEELGKLVIASAAMDIPLHRKPQTALFFRIGTGLVYSTNPYDRDNNNKNTMISSTISYLIQSRLTFEYKFHEDFKLTPSLNITHASNGAQRIPNKGINMVTANMGLSYRISEAEKPNPEEVELPTLDPKWKYYAMLSAGRNTLIFQQRDPKLFFNLIAYAAKPLNLKSDFQIGAELSLNNSIKTEIKYQWDATEEETQSDYKRVGIFIGHELKAGNLGFITQFGYYAYNPSGLRMPVYQRYGLKWQFHKNILMAVTLKVHSATAEQAEFGLGWKF